MNTSALPDSTARHLTGFRRQVLLATVCALAIACRADRAPAQTTPVSAAISDTSTIKPGGPRAGTGNANFFNAEGNAYNTNASFGVLQFAVTAHATPGQVSSLTLTLVQSNAAFSVAGPLNFYLTQNNASVIANTGGSTLIFDNSALPDGINNQLSPHDLIGTGSYSVVANGTQDVFTLGTLSTADRTYLNDLYTNGGTLRLIVAPAADSTAATYGGVSSTVGAPQLSLNVTTVPEPSSWVALALAAGALARGRRSRRRAGASTEV